MPPACHSQHHSIIALQRRGMPGKRHRQAYVGGGGAGELPNDDNRGVYGDGGVPSPRRACIRRGGGSIHGVTDVFINRPTLLPGLRQ